MIKKLFLPLLALALGACNEHDDIENVASIENIKKNTTFHNVTNYIHFVKNGGTKSRSAVMNSINPYLNENGDTIAYIANYDESWELLSNDRRTPMVLASSDKGSFNLDEIKENDNLNSYWNSIEDGLTALKEVPATENDTLGTGWNAYYLENGNVAEEDLVRTSATYVGATPGENGYWEVIDSQTETTIDEQSNHAITTTWDQYMNSFIPKKQNDQGEWVNCPTGCTAIAGAQYLYYLHHKNNMPQYMVDNVTYNATTYNYTFSGNSEEVWEYMEDLHVGEYYKHLMIGYVAQNVSTSFGLTSTVGDKDKLKNLINSYGYNYSWHEYSSNSIINLLKQHGAILTITTNNNSRSNNSIAPHALIIDAYKIETTETITTYGWVGEDSNGMDTNLRDFEGNIIGYGFTTTKTTKNTQKIISMNWGIDRSGTYNDIGFAVETPTWVAGNLSYNYRIVLY